jgi:AraC family transcriptional regulator
MRPSQRELYAERIERVVRYIEGKPPEESTPDLAELARVAGMSEFHFHRVFRLMTGETVGEATRRIRLARTLPSLAGSGTVTEASGASGYATPQGFARALKRQAGTSASAARSGADTLEALASALRSPPAPDGQQSTALAIEVVSVDPFRLLAIRNVGAYEELNAGYTRLFDLVLAQVPPDALLGIYGVPHDDPRFTAPADFRFDCALATGGVGSAEADLTELHLGGGDYARLRHLGSYDNLFASMDLLYAGAIHQLDGEIGTAPTFIHYLDDPEEVAEADLRSDLYLPVA